MDDDLVPGIASWNARRFAEAADRLEDVWVGEVGARRECLPRLRAVPSETRDAGP